MKVVLLRNSLLITCVTSAGVPRNALYVTDVSFSLMSMSGYVTVNLCHQRGHSMHKKVHTDVCGQFLARYLLKNNNKNVIQDDVNLCSLAV